MSLIDQARALWNVIRNETQKEANTKERVANAADAILDAVEEMSGTDGASAYDIAVQNGYVGTVAEWLESLKGSDGIDGVNGTNGTDGYSPYIGANGNWFINGVDLGVKADYSSLTARDGKIVTSSDTTNNITVDMSKKRNRHTNTYTDTTTGTISFSNLVNADIDTLFILNNTAAKAFTMLIPTSSIVSGGVTYTIVNMNALTSISVASGKSVEIHILIEYVDATHAEIRIISKSGAL